MVRKVNIRGTFNDKSQGVGAECGICGKPTKRPVGRVHLVDGSMEIVAHPDDTYDDEAADMGWWPIGGTCAKRLPPDFIAH